MARIILFLCVSIALPSKYIALGENSNPDASKKSAKIAFEQKDIVPQFISTVPDANLDVVYVDFNATEHVVNFGNQLEVENTLQEPVVSWDADKNALYSLIMFDADEPTPETRSIRSPYLHWMVTNIPSNALDRGETSAPYLFNLPPSGPAHRYLFVLYKQSGNVTNDLKDALVRPKFSILDFTSQHNMTGPVAGNFFKLQTMPGPLP